MYDSPQYMDSVTLGIGLREWWRHYRRRRASETVRMEAVEISWLGITGKWVADRDQQRAAWEMYVELITRISIQPLARDEGLLREALASLYSLFGETRRILKSYGPGVAQPLPGSDVSFGQLAVEVLNRLLRPLLARWHPLLLEHEQQRAQGVGAREHERRWAHHGELRRELERIRGEMSSYATLLAKASGISGLHGSRP